MMINKVSGVMLVVKIRFR